MLPRREKFPLTNNLHSLRHIVHDYKKSGLQDEQILILAKKEGRILVTKNIKDFVTKCKTYHVDVIGVSEQLPSEELDKLLVANLGKRSSPKTSGRFFKIVKVARKAN